MSPTGIHINKSFVVVILCLLAAIVAFYRFWYAAPHIDILDTGTGTMASKDIVNIWSRWKLENIPTELAKGGSDLVEEKTFDVTLGETTIKVFSRQAKPKDSTSEISVLFLHGQAFTSDNWNTINSLGLVALWGYRAVAIDLPPDYGKTKASKYLESENGAFIEEVVKVLGLNRPVIVSPSMSGKFSLPYIFQEPELAVKKCRGYIPVAPVTSARFADAYAKVQVPTMYIYGEKDKTPMKAESIKNFALLPVSKAFEFKGAGHACYMNEPGYFNQLLYNFLKLLQ